MRTLLCVKCIDKLEVRISITYSFTDLADIQCIVSHPNGAEWDVMQIPGWADVGEAVAIISDHLYSMVDDKL